MLTKVLRDVFAKVARRSSPSNETEALLSRAQAAMAADDAAAAIVACRLAVAVDPASYRAQHLLGAILAQQGSLDEARVCLAHAAALAPANPDVHTDFGNLHNLAGNDAQALACFERVLTLSPGDCYAAIGAARALEHLERPAEAVALLQSVLTAEAEVDVVRALLGLLERIGEVSEARKTAEGILAAHPDHAQALAAHGFIVLKHDQDAAAAAGCFERALVTLEDDPDLWSNYGIALQELGELERAMRCYERALAISPEHSATLVHRSLLMLLRGDFDAGWIQYEHRRRAPDWIEPPYRLPSWEGESLTDGTLLIHSEQGLGDEILFATCISEVLRRVGRVVLECHPRLVPIFQRSFPTAEVVSLEIRGKAQPTADAMVALGSLPRILRNVPDHCASAYLQPDANIVETYRRHLAALGPGIKVGISWRGGTPRTRGALRSIPAQAFQPLLEVSGVQFINLQYGDVVGDVSEWSSNGIEVHQFPDALADYDRTAALVQALDLIVSVDTAVLQLAGALGCEVWALLNVAPDWRYGAMGEAMAWYPNARLYRQRRFRVWSDVVERAAADLRLRVRGA